MKNRRKSYQKTHLLKIKKWVEMKNVHVGLEKSSNTATALFNYLIFLKAFNALALAAS